MPSSAVPRQATPPWLYIDITGGSRDAHHIRIRLLRDTVEVWYADRCQGIFDREVVRGWIASQQDWLISNDVLLAACPGWAAVAIRGRVPLGGVTEAVLDQLRNQV
jgi:hypothetical protein